MNYTRFWYNQSHMEGPKKPKLRIEHFSDDLEKQEKIKKLKRMYREIADKEIKTEEDLEKLKQIDYSLRQLLPS